MRLEKFGLAKLAHDKPDFFWPMTREEQKAQGQPGFDTEEYTYPKGFKCPVCEKSFVSTLARESKIRIKSVDFDLHPICHPVDPNFYEAIMCPKCGYCAVRTHFQNITHRQADVILAEISPNFIYHDYPEELTAEMALEKYELALINSLTKKANDGEIAYICMKIMWIYKSKGDMENHKKFVELTLNGFTNALMSEDLPIMGMQDDTITYLLGALNMFLENKQEALKLLSGVIVSKTASTRLKDRARDLKDGIKPLGT